jgi:hypothetical protein
METTDAADEPKDSVKDPSPSLGDVSVKYLDDRAAESFKSQTDLE